MITFSADRMTSFFVILLIRSLWNPAGALLLGRVKNDSCPTSGYVTKTLTVSDKLMCAAACTAAWTCQGCCYSAVDRQCLLSNTVKTTVLTNLVSAPGYTMYWTDYGEGFQRIGRKAYRLVTSHLSHHKARLNCANMGASLALPRNKDEIDAVRRLYSSASVWIMVSDATVENTWENTDTGEDLSFFNFASRQPNGGTAENCVYIKLINGLWHDYNCGYGLWFVCEVPAP
ncbi:C-type lectin domain family 3 member A-like [Homarus americanus]|uniref:C-type lectin domain family 3 member A-like n=1 Tax=Homarus americanus TaxID=6706 RepID=UPI001C466C64|nr:C-type lectin domain family 3 member A-like [Homarus americanus]